MSDLEEPATGARPVGSEELQWGPPVGRSGGRSLLVLVGGLTVVVLLVVAVALSVVQRGEGSPPPGPPSSPGTTAPSPKPLPGSAEVRVVRDGPPVRRDAAAGSTVYALGTSTVYSLDLVTGEAVAHPLPAGMTPGTGGLVPLQDGVLVPDDSGGYWYLAGAGQAVEPTDLRWVLGAGPGEDVWVWADGETVELHDLSGQRGETVDLGGASTLLTDGRLVLSEAGRVWWADKGSFSSAGWGRAAAARWPHLLLVTCDESRRCRGVVHDVTDGSRRAVSEELSLTGTMDMSPDGRWAVTDTRDGSQIRTQLVDLSTGEVVSESGSLSTDDTSWAPPTRWLPDSSAVVCAERGATLQLLATDGTTTDLGLPGDGYSSIAVSSSP